MHLDPWTFALQAINAGVLIWLLARFLFRPIRAMIEQRRLAAETLLADAQAAKAKAEADAADIARQRQDFAKTGERILAEAHSQAEADAAAQRDHVAQTITRMRDEAAAELGRERAVMQAALAHDAADLAVTIARRLLARAPAAAVTEALLRDLADRLGKQPEAERALLAAVPIEVRTAVPLTADQQSACVALLSGVLARQGQPPVISFMTDPALLAGVELRASHTLIRNNWQADLERIAGDLRSEDDHDARPARVA
jgi:F-type H+-transporting ATPase subunit b